MTNDKEERILIVTKAGVDAINEFIPVKIGWDYLPLAPTPILNETWRPYCYGHGEYHGDKSNWSDSCSQECPFIRYCKDVSKGIDMDAPKPQQHTDGDNSQSKKFWREQAIEQHDKVIALEAHIKELEGKPKNWQPHCYYQFGHTITICHTENCPFNRDCTSYQGPVTFSRREGDK
jgi:hypothetical protein